VRGTVCDPNGTPVEGANIKLQTAGRMPHITISNKDGLFTVGIVGANPKDTVLIVEKKGYRHTERPLGSQNSTMMHIVLVPIDRVK
jgi:hypothetical protein